MPSGVHTNLVTDASQTFSGVGATYTPGQTYAVTLNSPTNTINGFVIWAQDTGGNYQGTWAAGNGQLLCGGSSTSLGHNGPFGDLTTLVGSWTAPNAGVGNLVFKTMIVPGGSSSYAVGTSATMSQVVVVPTGTSKTVTGLKTSAPPATSAPPPPPPPPPAATSDQNGGTPTSDQGGAIYGDAASMIASLFTVLAFVVIAL